MSDDDAIQGQGRTEPNCEELLAATTKQLRDAEMSNKCLIEAMNKRFRDQDDEIARLKAQIAAGSPGE